MALLVGQQAQKHCKHRHAAAYLSKIQQAIALAQNTLHGVGLLVWQRQLGGLPGVQPFHPAIAASAQEVNAGALVGGGLQRV